VKTMIGDGCVEALGNYVCLSLDVFVNTGRRRGALERFLGGVAWSVFTEWHYRRRRSTGFPEFERSPPRS